MSLGWNKDFKLLQERQVVDSGRLNVIRLLLQICHVSKNHFGKLIVIVTKHLMEVLFQ
jgi:hypothetical protein